MPILEIFLAMVDIWYPRVENLKQVFHTPGEIILREQRFGSSSLAAKFIVIVTRESAEFLRIEWHKHCNMIEQDMLVGAEVIRIRRCPSWPRHCLLWFLANGTRNGALRALGQNSTRTVERFQHSSIVRTFRG